MGGACIPQRIPWDWNIYIHFWHKVLVNVYIIQVKKSIHDIHGCLYTVDGSEIRRLPVEVGS